MSRALLDVFANDPGPPSERAAFNTWIGAETMDHEHDHEEHDACEDCNGTGECADCDGGWREDVDGCETCDDSGECQACDGTKKAA